MRISLIAALLVQIGVVAYSQTQPSFEVVSARTSQREVGPDYNNQITYSTGEFNARNVTLQRLIAEAWHCQLNQVIGPAWLGHNEYDIAARLPAGSTNEQVPLMIRSLLSERFNLKVHAETRRMRAYELTVAPGGPRIHPMQPGAAATAGAGLHFRGTMRRFADFLAVQFSIPAPASPNEPVKASEAQAPVLDKTGLDGIFEFNVDLRPELGTDAFTAWKRVLKDQLGLEIQSAKGDVAVVVVDEAAKIPSEN